MFKIILILLLASFSYANALTVEEEDILALHDENIRLVDDYISSNKSVIRDFLAEGGRCNNNDTSYVKGLRSFFDYGKNLPYAQEGDYEEDEEYIDTQEKKELLEEKRNLLEGGTTLIQTRQLSDGTEFTESITGYDGIYDEEIEELELKGNQIISKYRIRHIKERQKHNQLQDHLAREVIQACVDVRDEIELGKESLYLKLEQIEADNPGSLQAIALRLKEIKNQEKYKKYTRIIDSIISYIENR